MLALGRLGGLTNRLTGQRCDFVELGCQILVDCQRLRVTCRRLLRPHALCGMRARTRCEQRVR